MGGGGGGGGVLNRDGEFIPNHIFLKKFILIFINLLLHQELK